MPWSDFLNFLRVPLGKLLAVAIASSILLFLSLAGWLDLSVFAPYATPILSILALFSFVLAGIELVSDLLTPWRERKKAALLYARRSVRMKERTAARAAAEKAALEHLDHLSEGEIERVAECLREGSPSFLTYVHAGNVSHLCAKGLAYTPGGSHLQDYYPYSLHLFAWKEILKRKDEFLAKDAAIKAAKKARDGR